MYIDWSNGYRYDIFTFNVFALFEGMWVYDRFNLEFCIPCLLFAQSNKVMFLDLVFPYLCCLLSSAKIRVYYPDLVFTYTLVSS